MVVDSRVCNVQGRKDGGGLCVYTTGRGEASIQYISV